MKRNLLKIGAMASLSVGALLLAQPAVASWQKCITDGGYQTPVKHNECSPVLSPYLLEEKLSAVGPCYESKTQKGYYCESQTQTASTCTEAADRDVNPYHRNGSCMLQFIDDQGNLLIMEYVNNPLGRIVNTGMFSIQCSPSGAWSQSSETVQIGDCTPR